MFISKKVLAGTLGILLLGVALFGLILRNNQTGSLKNEQAEDGKSQNNNDISQVGVAASSSPSSSVATKELSAALKSNVATKPAVESFTTAISFNPNVPFEFGIPKGFNFGPDIGATVVVPENSTRENKLMFVVSAFPDETANSTEEYMQNQESLHGYVRTGETRIIGGYKAYRLQNPKKSNETIYGFLTKYHFSFEEFGSQVEVDPAVSSQLSNMKYGIFIVSNLSQLPKGKEAEEFMLSTFKFVD